MLSKLKNKMGTILFIGIALLACLLMTGAAKKLPTLPKTEKILWTGYWDTDNFKNRFYCVVTEDSSKRILAIYKSTSQGNKKIYSYSTYNYFGSAYQAFNNEGLYFNWRTGSSNVFQLFEYDSKTLKIKKTFETPYRSSPEIFSPDNNEEYLMNGDVDGFFWTNEGTLSFQTAIFYQRVPGNGYSKFTTCKWVDRYSMMDTISKQST